MVGTFLLVFLVLQYSERSVMSITIRTSTTRGRGTEHTPKNSAGGDDTDEVFKGIEDLKLLPLVKIPKLKNVAGRILNDTVADAALVQYISECQYVVVALRHSYLDILRGHAEWIAHWYEVHFPDYYACVTRNLISLMRDSMTEYPKKVIMKLRTVKDAFLRSYITKKPISIVDPGVFEGLNELLRDMEHILTVHRDGDRDGNQAAGLEELVEVQIIRHEKMVRDRCKIPMSDGHTALSEEHFTDYLGDEDYSSVDYFII